MSQLTESQWQTILEEVQFRFVRSSGPGGQKVNKTASKAELRWPIQSSAAFTESPHQRLLHKLGSQITSDGEIVIQADTQRSRLQNKSEALDRLRDLVEEALHVEKKRRKTRPKKSAIKKRLNEKKQQGDKKRNRQKVDY